MYTLIAFATHWGTKHGGINSLGVDPPLKALLNHEVRYWRGLLTSFGWPEPERLASQLLALATLAGGFATPREARPYWATATASPTS